MWDSSKVVGHLTINDMFGSGLKYLMTISVCVAFLFSCVQELEVTPAEEEAEEINVDEIEIENSEAFRNTIAEALAENKESHESLEDYSWTSSEEVKITLNGNSISVSGSGATASGSKVKITSGGVYNISGTLDDGQIVVETDDEDIVRLILNGVTISNSTTTPIFISAAAKTLIYLADGTKNFVTDAATYVFESSEDDEPNAAIFSKEDLTIAGTGSLTVDANYNDGIAGKDGLIIKNGTIIIDAEDDGIRGKDYIIIHDGNFIIDAGGDGLKSDNDEDTARGYIYIENGNFDISSGTDAIQAKTDVLLVDGSYVLNAGGGSANNYNSDRSLKGLKASVNLIIDNGDFTISTADDAIHSNGSLVVNNGIFEIASGDDAIHADGIIYINDGTITISKSYEGIESSVININGGDIHINASDDGLNVAGGNDASGQVRPGMGNFSGSSDYYIFINGGKVVISASGDGVDANGSISMTGGVVLVHGPTSNNNSAIDYDGVFQISGGFLAGAGSSGMAQAPGTSSSQYSLLINLSSTMQGGTLFHIQSGDDDEILTFAPTKNYQSLAFSSPDLANGKTYEIYYGGSSSGSESDGLYTGGAYTAGTKLGSLTISAIVTKVSSR
jgi:hypothetical protein